MNKKNKGCDLVTHINFNPMKTTKTRRKDLAYQQTVVGQALQPMEKPEALLDWSIEQLLKLVKK